MVPLRLFHRQWKLLPAFTRVPVKFGNGNVCFSKDCGLSTSLHEENKMFNILKARINAVGPLSIADYMKESLISPELGYYMKQDVFGKKGDFITSPEISQMFGELIGVWFCNEWLKAGRPKPLQFVEFGPGRGTLADDVLRVFCKILTAYEVPLSVHLIEMSPHLKTLQKSTLGIVKNEYYESFMESGDGKVLDYVTKHGFPAMFHDSLDTVPEGFSFFLAHEFFDALPVHKFQKTDHGWREVLIDCREDRLQFVLSGIPTPATKCFIDPNEKRDHVEVSPEAGILTEKLCKRMKEDGGISLIIDYGHDGTKTDTFRSFKSHKLHDPLENPGDADLTADVDFSYLRKCVKDEGYIAGPVTQEQFLKNMGIDIRLQKLMENATSEVQESLKSGYDMLTKPDQMGERFKFFAIYPKVLNKILGRYPPAGFTNSTAQDYTMSKVVHNLD